jgi:hypothetical protein
MKYSAIQLIIILFISQIAIAQDCSTFYPFEEGSVSEITSYDKKQRVAAILEYSVVESSGDKASLQAIIKDKKGKLLTKTQYNLICNNDGIEIDFKSMYNPQMMMQFENMETKVTGTNIVLPNNLSVGDELPDANMKINISMSGINMNTAVTMSQRKVVGKEEVTTSAGTFDCYVITYTNNVEASMGISMETTSKQWIAKGVGMVKQEDYNKKGKISSSSMLTAFKK